MSIGRRDQLITFQSAGVIDDGYTSREDWDNPTDIASEWAAVFYGRGDERRQAAMEQGGQAATFQVLSNTNTRSVGVANRIDGAGSIWDIVAISPDTPKRGLIEFTAVRSAP